MMMMTLEVVQKLAPESDVEFMAPISGAGFWSVRQGLNDGGCRRACGLSRRLIT